MTDRRAFLGDPALAEALRSLGTALAVPVADGAGEQDLAARVRARIVAEADVDIAPSRGAWWEGLLRPFAGLGRIRRGLVLAVILLLAIAAAAGAVGFGLPGIRILLGPLPTPVLSAAPTTSPPPGTTSVPGATLGLGTLALPDDIDRLTAPEILGFTVRRPTDLDVGAPDATYLAGTRVTMVWAATPTLPATETSSVGLVLTQFRGSVDPGYLGKIVGPGTTVERMDVVGAPGFWIAGEVHFFFYEDPSGQIVEESRRFVGDTLIWTVDDVTYRLETATGLDRVLAIAASLR